LFFLVSLVSGVPSCNRKAAEHENRQDLEKSGKIAGKSWENKIFINAMSELPPNKSFQPWKIDIVDKSLQYARNIATRKVALTISLAYSTIKEWYYLVREQEKFQAAGQDANSSHQEGE